MSIYISSDMYLRLGLHVQIRLYYVLPYKAKISAQHGIDFILDRCIVYLGLTMPNLKKKRLLIFEIFNIKCAHFFLEPNMCVNCFINFHHGFYKTFVWTDDVNRDQTAQTVRSDVRYTQYDNCVDTFFFQKQNCQIEIFIFLPYT